ncbi:uncharacterized protein LOC142342794 isoform X2 [Convolutriloba macropyga]|uniref:uncharacterized protein LOC142342794 isoform X2 n=1 Tax=Convolutriloba macropyga TaxID=536237 RepID=UPI003F52690E
MSDLDALPVKPPAKQSEAFRKEQLKKWEASETATVSPDIKSKRWAVQFPLELLFLSACEGGDVEYARELLHMGVNINAKNCDGLAALHQATVNTDEDMMQFLIENDADLDIFDNEGWTPLHAAASVGSITFVELLIAKGANPVAVNHDGDTPFDLVKSDGDSGVREYLQQVIEDAGIDLLEWKQAEENQMRDDATKWLKERDRAKANQRHPETGATPLHVAASKNFVDVMRILLRSGADPDAMDNDKWTPLHAAAHWSLADAAKVLTEYGANFGLENKNGHTAKDLAENDMLTILQQLEQQQQDLIEARKCNSDEIEDSLSRPINPNPTRRSSVVRSSMIDSGNMKQKDKELEKIEIRKQASDPLPTIPPTPVTPPDDNRIMPSEIIPTRDPEPSRGLANDENLVVTTKDAEVASVSSEEGDDELTTNDITADNDDTGSMISSISSSVREPAPESSEVTVPIDGKPADDEKISGVGAFDEIVKELEQSDRSASETSVPAEEKVEEAPKVKSRVDRIETVPLRGASVKLQMPFNRALQSSDSVPLPQPKTTVSRRPKEPEEKPVAVVVPPPPIVEVVKTDSIETISNPDKLDPTPDVIKQVEERPKKPPLTGVNLLSIEDADSITNNKENEQNKDAKRDPISTVNEDETSTGGGLKRTASWRVKKGKEKESSKEKEVEKPPTEAKVEETAADTVVEEKEEVEKSESEAMPPSAVSTVTITDTTQATPPTSKVEESESDQVTPNAILLPKSEEKEITRKQRARFERSTRRSTQGVSAADLESALASPHSHAIREDKKEERERIESKFMPSSPAVVSPTPQGSTILPPGANPSQLRPHSQQQPPNQLEETPTSTRNFRARESYFNRHGVILDSPDTPNAARSISSTLGANPSDVNESRDDMSDYSARMARISSLNTPSAAALLKSNSLRKMNSVQFGSLPTRSSYANVKVAPTANGGGTDQEHTEYHSLDRGGLTRSPISQTPSCPNCHQHVAYLEAEVKRLNNELSLFRSSPRWDEVQKERKDRVDLSERVSTLEVQLADYETVSRNYHKVRAENASLIRLLANFVRSEYNIPSGRTPRPSGSTSTLDTSATLGATGSTASVSPSHPSSAPPETRLTNHRASHT